jgi:hypothetical protein
MLFSKFVPIISIWEMKAGDHPSPALSAAGCTSARSGDAAQAPSTRSIGRRRGARAVSALQPAASRATRSPCSAASRSRTSRFRATRRPGWSTGQRRRHGRLDLATWLTRMTELAWPIKTGNMPIVSW